VTKVLLSLHVLAAIIAVGPVTVAASMFPALLRTPDHPAALRILHRICRVYAGIGILVPLFGLATASSLGVLTDAWLIASMILTVAAAALLAFTVLPRQQEALTLVGQDQPTAPLAARLGMLTGLFNLLWATVVVLMIVRPGSTTGA
jgi:hypothetical protein